MDLCGNCGDVRDVGGGRILTEAGNKMGMRKILDGETKSNILHPAPLTSVDTNKLKCMIFHIKKR
jgi:hypothetical protein